VFVSDRKRKPCCVQEAVCNAVLEAFIEYLIDEKEIDLVAIYVATLPCARQVELYARLLKGTEPVMFVIAVAGERLRCHYILRES